jgi:hypothetical protein
MPEESGGADASEGSGHGRLTRILAIAGALITVGAGAVGLLFKLHPSFEPCIGGAGATFIDAPVFPETVRERGYVAGVKYVRGLDELGAEVRITVRADNLRGSQLQMYYTLLTAGARGATDEVVSGADEIPAESKTSDTCSWTGGWDVWVLPLPTGLEKNKRYRIVLELFRGQRQADGGNRLALLETPVFQG